MESLFVICLITLAACLQKAQSQQRFYGYERMYYPSRPLTAHSTGTGLGDGPVRTVLGDGPVRTVLGDGPVRTVLGDGPVRTGLGDGPVQTGQRQLLTNAEKVRLDVYYETDCPDSMRFITRQLYPVYKDMKDIVDIHLVPFGKASEQYDSVSKKYVFRCHHGPAECYGNTVQSCAMSFYPKIEEHLEFIKCMESYPRPSDNGRKCARRLSMDWKKISKCVDGDEGNKLLHEQAVLTTSLNPKLTFVPWITVNKVYSDTNQRRSLRNLKTLVCDSYKGQHLQCSK